MPVSFLPYAKQSIDESDLESVKNALKGDIITRGQHVREFEEAIAHYCKAKYAVAFCNGTAALMASYFSANVTPSDRVISTPNTFIATVLPAIQLGIYPQFIDIDQNTGHLDLHFLKEELDFRSTRGKLVILPVHFSGIAMNMQAFDELLYQHPNAVIIEDAAHALGSFYSTGEKVGSCVRSNMTIFSFHPAKTITTGEGGMVTTNDLNLYHRLRLFRDNGIERESSYLEGEANPGYYEVKSATGNFHLTEFQAALGLSQLSRIDRLVKKRRKLVKLYRNLLQDVPGIRLFTNQFDELTAFHLFVIQVNFSHYTKRREEVMKELEKRKIGTQVHYIPLYRHPVLKNKKQSEWQEYFPNMEEYYRAALSLPLYYELSEKDVHRVCKELIHCLNNSNT